MQDGVDPQGRPTTGQTDRGAAASRPDVARAAIAHAFLAEYHRLLADALSDAGTPPDVRVRRRAFAWHVTAARIPLVPGRCWPTWLLDHLAALASTPVVGPEYRRSASCSSTYSRTAPRAAAPSRD